MKVSPDIYLYMKNEKVMTINFDLGKFLVHNDLLLPFCLKNRIYSTLGAEEENSKLSRIEERIIDNKNREAFISFLSRRVLPLSRENAKKIYNLYNFSQDQSEINKAHIALICKAVSLQDNYWVKSENDLSKWEDVNIRTNHLNEVVAQVALHGSSFSIEAKKEMSPELTSHGAYAKAWKRENNELYLYKKGYKGSFESKVEIMVSNLLDGCNVSHLKYEAAESNGEYCCKCKCMTTDEISMLSGLDFDSYCNQLGLDSRKEALRIDSDIIFKMYIVDYLIANRDRHNLNWGFYYNSDTCEIIGCHPLYDHNNAFDIEFMKDKNVPYLYDDNMTMKQAAEYAMKRVDFHFTKEFTRNDFLTERQYNCFCDRAKELGIKTILINKSLNENEEEILEDEEEK